MRIRKNRKLCHGLGLGVDNAEQLQPHFCQLNQSPWDAIPFTQESVRQFERQNSFDGNGTLYDSVPAAADDRETVMDNQEAKLESEFKLNRSESSDIDDKDTWHCKNENEPADSMCGHHFAYVKSCSSSTADSHCDLGLTDSPIKKTEKVNCGARRRVRLRAAKRTRSLNSNWQEFYYYSGFGPLWGKKKDRGEGKSNKGSIDNERLIGGGGGAAISGSASTG
ncbi:uncharacterized protein LOC8263505 [Ricinus communis]|uniref:uncharacterized protein LOC8263505 n=1 Tax=Ricinus communis TaxID=3988 RepID=UPI00201B01FD|nr:uncharacterized protein LOC8263505 [Ricinus communis]